MVTLTITILKHLLQGCYCECEHFATVGVEGFTTRILVSLTMFLLAGI